MRARPCILRAFSRHGRISSASAFSSAIWVARAAFSCVRQGKRHLSSLHTVEWLDSPPSRWRRSSICPKVPLGASKVRSACWWNIHTLCIFVSSWTTWLLVPRLHRRTRTLRSFVAVSTVPAGWRSLRRSHFQPGVQRNLGLPLRTLPHSRHTLPRRTRRLCQPHHCTRILVITQPFDSFFWRSGTPCLVPPTPPTMAYVDNSPELNTRHEGMGSVTSPHLRMIAGCSLQCHAYPARLSSAPSSRHGVRRRDRGYRARGKQSAAVPRRGPPSPTAEPRAVRPPPNDVRGARQEGTKCEGNECSTHARCATC